MSLLPTETKKEIVEYYKTHNVIDTIQKFGISRASLARYARKYDGTDESLEDGRTTRENVYKFSERETEMLLASLKKYNPPGRRRNIIEPSYEEIYKGDTEFKGKRSYQSIRNKASKLLKELE